MSDRRDLSRGFIDEGLYPWWVGGVLFGAVVVALAASLYVVKVPLMLVWAGALASAIALLCSFDTRGRLRRLRATLAGAGLWLMGTSVMHQRPGRFMAVAAGTALAVVYLVFGCLGLALGEVALNHRPGRMENHRDPDLPTEEGMG